MVFGIPNNILHFERKLEMKDYNQIQNLKSHTMCCCCKIPEEFYGYLC